MGTCYSAQLPAAPVSELDSSNMVVTEPAIVDVDLNQLRPSQKRSICGIDYGYPNMHIAGAVEDDELLDPTHLKSVVDNVLLPLHDAPFKPNPEEFSSRRNAMIRHLNNNNVSDCCIGIPLYYTCEQRRELLSTASAGGWRPCKLLHQTTAAALMYMFSSADLLQDDTVLNIVFIDMSEHLGMQVSVVELKKDQLKVLSHAYDRSVCGFQFDYVVHDYFSRRKPSFSEAQALKERLSSESEVEDGGTILKRAEFEELSFDQLEEVKVVLQKALRKSRIQVDFVNSVQVVGNGSKIPAVMKELRDFFGKEPIETILECYPVATGCFIHCAILCGAYNIPKFQIVDILSYSIELDYMTGKQVLFPKGHPIPSIRNVTFDRRSTFFLDLVSNYPDNSYCGITSYMIGPFDCNTKKEVNVKVQVDLHGISFIESAILQGDIIISVVEYTRVGLHAEQQKRLIDSHKLMQESLNTEDRINALQLTKSNVRLETTTKQHEEVQTALQKKLVDMSAQLNEETKRRMEIEKILENKESECRKFQIERNEVLKERDDALKKVDELSQMNFTFFSLSELKQATNYFDSAHKIGEGGYGSVYKGTLQNKEFAIKILNKHGGQGVAEFNQEVAILNNVRHPNLIRLKGASLEAQALVYEFMPNGSLDKFLTGGKNSRVISWQDRVRIASEICSALICLHTIPPHGIAHGDLKPENILLDSNYVIKLTDFGISRKLKKTNKTETPLHETQSPTYTPAYVDPEYISSNQLTAQSDIYAFGIILLQLVTGRDPQWIMEHFDEETLNSSNLNGVIDSSAGKWPLEEAKKLASLGFLCSDQLRRKRPDLVKDVLPSLESMKNIAGLDINQVIFFSFRTSSLHCHV